MAVQVTNYQCPACNGPLQFDGPSGKLACEYCGSTYPVAEIEAMYAEKDAKAAGNMAAAEAKRGEDAGEWNLSGLNDDWGADAQGMKAYNCPSCGAELICDATTAATSCPYCGNPTVVPGQFQGMLKPDFVIPFKLKKADAIAALKKHYEGKPLLPGVFKDENHLEEIKGVYVPFWLFDGEGEGDVSYDATRTRTYRDGDEEVTETDHYDVYRSGYVAFERIPVDGSSKMPDDYMDSIEPFNYADLTAFSAAYLPGFLADKYDVSAEESGRRADARAENTVESCLRDTVRGYDTVSVRQRHIRLHRGEVKYALLPVWLLTTKWNDQNYLFAMNGQTGKFVGNLPVDKGKKWRMFALVYGVTAVVTALAVLFPGGLLNLLGM
ncbi:MAG: hypothetical protein IJC43_00550 [Clostridia bacterium]|nr:hypothetical protein [Clostridia bacterium]